LLFTDISLKEIPLLIPVPKALAKASFAANLFEYEEILFDLDSQYLISFLENILFLNLLFVLKVFFILSVLTMSVPIPKILSM